MRVRSTEHRFQVELKLSVVPAPHVLSKLSVICRPLCFFFILATEQLDRFTFIGR